MILIVVDHLTKFVLLKALSKGTALQITDFLKNEVFCVFGVPHTIHSDNGSQFKSLEYKNLLHKFGVTYSKTAIYSPQSNASERVNRSILCAIRSYVAEKHTSWDKHLDEIASALRNGVHETIQNSPHFLLFGYHKINHGHDYKILKQLGELSEGEILLPLPARLQLIHDKAKIQIAQAYEKSSKRYNLRTRPVEFSINQNVFVRTHLQSDSARKFCAKFAPQFIKAVVSKRIGNVMYEVRDMSNKKLGVFHAKDIRL